MNNSTAASATKITTWRKLEKGFKADAMLDSTLYAALFAGTLFWKLACRFPTIYRAYASYSDMPYCGDCHHNYRENARDGYVGNLPENGI